MLKERIDLKHYVASYWAPSIRPAIRACNGSPVSMVKQAFMNQSQPILANIDKMAKEGLQATFKQIYAVFCNILHTLVDI